jgi:DNA-binding GntR family transcriptional regulator
MRHAFTGLRTLPRPPRPARHRLQRQTIPEELAAALRERILSGKLPEGSLMRQEALAVEYGVSRIPVREAFRLLEGEGLVDLQTHRGAIVTAHSPEQLGELFDLRAMLERDLLVRAVPLASAQDVARAEEVLRRVEAAYEEHDAHAWGALNSEFHRSLYLPARREQTLALVESINVITERAIRLYHRLATAFAQAQAEHRELLRLYRARKAEQAGALLERHVLFTKSTLVGALQARLAAQQPGASAPKRRRRR